MVETLSGNITGVSEDHDEIRRSAVFTWSVGPGRILNGGRIHIVLSVLLEALYFFYFFK